MQRALLVRIGVDQAYGGWNAPVDTETGEFVYAPIPEAPTGAPHPGLGRRWDEVMPALTAFADARGVSPTPPASLRDAWAHLDPDFAHLTYGDNGARRGARLHALAADDLVVFYAGLRPVSPRRAPLCYALIGLYVVDEVVPVPAVPAARRGENAHTRRAVPSPTDLVVRARPGCSGRLARCLPIGEFRDRAYRVRRDLLEAWGGLSARDGYLQRSAVPPWLLDPARFADWFAAQGGELLATNH